MYSALSTEDFTRSYSRTMRVRFTSLPCRLPSLLWFVRNSPAKTFTTITMHGTPSLTPYPLFTLPVSVPVVLGHAFVTGGTVSESERPLSIGGADRVDSSYFAGFNYAALGHLHRPQSAGSGTCTVRGITPQILFLRSRPFQKYCRCGDGLKRRLYHRKPCLSRPAETFAAFQDI